MGSFGKPLPDRNRLAYSTSKTAVNMMTVQFDMEFRTENWNIKINSVNPGRHILGPAKTYMTNNKEGYPPPTQAARVIVYVATLPDDGPSGVFFDPENNKIPW
ncbi:unnamed protein product [Adineta steineri]|uniref:Uncharacterized protein n=1 Tax=Adineta steineri TaxID=433720 RepID=A0A816BT71_9BILA|nr:unnamed protein product [Adineta steineri]CAF1612431.1 unnamed protein product [Adineta steineri]